MGGNETQVFEWFGHPLLWSALVQYAEDWKWLPVGSWDGKSFVGFPK